MKNREILDRRDQIVSIIRSTGKLNTDEAAAMFGLSNETIRQDFLYLAKQGILKKVHGGAVLCDTDCIASLPIRENVQLLAKDKIAKKAMEYLPEGSCTIAMDAGSTVALLASYASFRKDLFVVTNSHRVLQNLVSTNNHIFSLGGDYYKDEMAYYTNEVPRLLRDISLDVYFLGTSGVKGRGGICTKGFPDRYIKRILLQKSKKKIVLADSNKFQIASLVEVAPWDELDILITDENIPKDILKELENHLQVIVV